LASKGGRLQKEKFPLIHRDWKC